MTETQRIQHDSKERVAYDLMRAISGAEPASDDKSTRVTDPLLHAQW